jgi:DNA-binding PadR family transcriptional regulator
MLHALTASDLLAVSERVVDGKRRKEYQLTAHGRAILTLAQRQIRELAHEVLPPDDAVLETPASESSGDG